MKTLDVKLKQTFIGSLLGIKPGVESRRYATEQEIVDGLTPCGQFDDYLSQQYRKCTHCDRHTLVRVQEYCLSIDKHGDDVITRIYSCSVCFKLHTPYFEHRYGYHQNV